MKFRTKYDSRPMRKTFRDTFSLTDQQFKVDTTLEGIVRRYGILPEPKVAPLSADVSAYGDFAELLQRVQSGLAEFQALPSLVRQRFGNDPRAFFDFVTNADNIDEIVKLGLATPRKVEVTEKDLLKKIVENTSHTVTHKGEEG